MISFVLEFIFYSLQYLVKYLASWPLLKMSKSTKGKGYDLF